MKKIDKRTILELQVQIEQLTEVSRKIYEFVKIREDKKMELEKELLELTTKIQNHPLYLDYLT